MSTRPLSYFQDLRSRERISAQFHNQESNVAEVGADGETFRLLHLALLSFLTLPGSAGFDSNGVPVRLPFDLFINWSASAFLAMVHFNDRDGSIIPQLPERLKSCDLHLTMEVFDTKFSPAEAASLLYPLLFLRNNTFQNPMPGGIVGDISSESSKPMALLSGLLNIPQVSASSSSSYFEEVKENSPTFARLMPSTSATARALVELLKHWNVTHAGLLYSRDEYGEAFLHATVDAAARNGISLVVSSMNADESSNITSASIKETIDKLKGMRYIVSTLYTNLFELMVDYATEIGLFSDQHVWIAPNTGGFAVEEVSRSQPLLANAFEHVAVVDLQFEPPKNFATEIMRIRYDMEFRNFFLNSTFEQEEIFKLFDWNGWRLALSSFAYTSYDAVMSMGIAACETEDRFFSPLDHYQQILKTSFGGSSGNVSFDPTTGSRSFEGVQFLYSSMRTDPETSDSVFYRLKLHPSMILHTSDGEGTSGPWIEEISPFRFGDGSVIPPSALPLLQENQQKIPEGLQFFCWTLGALGMLMALGLGIWTIRNRNNEILRLSQPLFLGMLCLGAFLMASSTLFLGWQEPWPALDFSCMATPWLLVLGFSTAFSALFTKIWRVNRLFHNAVDLTRTKLRAKDVFWAFLLITVINFALLTFWTIQAPLKWTRTIDENSVDSFGRSTLSYGSCKVNSDDQTVSLVILAFFNFIMVLFANYQSYISRHSPSYFNESLYVALCMASLLECFLIGGPILWLVASSPSADFVLKSVLIFVCCQSLLVPIYLHKFKVMQNGRRSLDAQEIQQAIRTYRAARRGSSSKYSNSTSSDPQSLVFMTQKGVNRTKTPNLEAVEENSGSSQRRNALSVIRRNTLEPRNQSPVALQHATEPP